MYVPVNGAPTVQTFVVYLLDTAGGSTTESPWVVASRDIDLAVRNVGEPAVFGFYFREIVTVVVRDDVTGEKHHCSSRDLKRSGTYYIDGKLCVLAQVRRESPNGDALAANMMVNGDEHLVKCRTGVFRSFKKGHDVIVPA